jgi:Kdo2-lipid IVA lauroyltransferase/acyltransferase
MRLLRWLSRRPLWLLHAWGAALGRVIHAVSPSYRRRFAENAALAGVAPDRARPAIAAAGQLVAELPFLWLRPADVPIGPGLQWSGLEVIDAAHARGHGIVYLTPHLGCFEVTAQALAERFGASHGPITVLFRPARQAWLREVMDASRARPGLATAPATLAGVRQMIRALRRGESVGLLPDQVPPEGMGVWAPFFGKPAYTMTLAARLVQQTGAVPLLIWGERLPRGAGFVVHVETLPEALPADASAQEEAAATINRAMEHIIRQCPQQYLWGYNRYKAPRVQEVVDASN